MNKRIILISSIILVIPFILLVLGGIAVDEDRESLLVKLMKD